VARILPAVIGDDFRDVVTAAQQGSEAAFSALWRDGNPDLLRYLRVAAPEAAEDVAAEVWVQVCRACPASTGTNGPGVENRDKRLVTEHARVIEALASDDPERAQEALRDHIRSGRGGLTTWCAIEVGTSGPGAGPG
jgi:hypothetical protein